MKAVILAAGKGSRMKELTLDTPKPLLRYQDKTLIEHKLETLPDHITDVVLVIGYLGDKIKDYFGDSWNSKNIHYVEQEEMLGTAHALFAAQHLLDEPFIVLMGDDLYGKEDLALLTSRVDGAHPHPWAVLVEQSEALQSGGKIIADEHGNLAGIVEDYDGRIPYNFVYTGACVLTPEIFALEMVQLPNSAEFGLPQTFASVAHERPIKIHHATFWKRITAPEDLL
jgi:NDP-sugar pyrophosphorylase family protein